MQDWCDEFVLNKEQYHIIHSAPNMKSENVRKWSDVKREWREWEQLVGRLTWISRLWNAKQMKAKDIL